MTAAAEPEPEPKPDPRDRARAYLAGQRFPLDDVLRIAEQCRKAHHLSFARQVFGRLRTVPGSAVGAFGTRAKQDRAITDEAQLISKDPELAAAVRHDLALGLLGHHFVDLDAPGLDSHQELMGVAGGICKRRWRDLGQLADLRRSAAFYGRGAQGALGHDAYCHVNAAYLDDVLAAVGDDPVVRQARARALRELIDTKLPGIDEVPADMRWWNAASRAEACFGLCNYKKAKAALQPALSQRPEDWQLETTVRQLAHLARLQHAKPWDDPDIFAFFDALIPGDASVVLRAVTGRVGLALSGGGFRAAFYHLGVLARLAELDALRHVSVLSCVSGGSIVGACYWLLLRRRLQAQDLPRDHDLASPREPRAGTLAQCDYVALVRELIAHFEQAVATDLKSAVKPTKLDAALRALTRNERGLIRSEDVAVVLEEHFYRPLARHQPDLPELRSLRMDDLPFQPRGHAEHHPGTAFQPSLHNWLRSDKVPVLTLNATTVNTGHAWQFTPTWMGESPWSVHEAADAIPRLEWGPYDEASGWTVSLARAVAASACVPFIFVPLELRGLYDGVTVRLVDGGVHDNQGTVALLAQDCNVVLVSDACGQLLFEAEDPGGAAGIPTYGVRSMDMLMERIRLANHADLAARRQVGLLSGLMFLHMKAGLDADVKRRAHSQASYQLQRSVLTPSGVRKDFQEALSNLRTDLDAFNDTERHGLMACGYQMTASAAALDLAEVPGLASAAPPSGPWPFHAMLGEITSTADNTPRRSALLAELKAGAKRS